MKRLASIEPGCARRAALYAAAVLLWAAAPARAQAPCLAGNNITAWEAMGGWRLLAHQGNRNLAFVYLAYTTCPYLQPGQRVALRLFSPSLCANDSVVVNGKACTVDRFEMIRQH